MTRAYIPYKVRAEHVATFPTDGFWCTFLFVGGAWGGSSVQCQIAHAAGAAEGGWVGAGLKGRVLHSNRKP